MTNTKVNMETYLTNPQRYELRTGSSEGAPLCPYGNQFTWVGYDKEKNEYIRYTKSVYKKLVNQLSKKS